MLFIDLLERMSLIALAAYIYNQSHIFKNLVKDKINIFERVGIIVFFSLLSILGTYTGINLEPYALANTRPIGAIVAGYIGGPLTGIIVGAIAGIHRYWLGGFTGLACALSTIVEGLVGGLVRKISKDSDLSIRMGFLAGVIAEILQVLIVLCVAKPFSDAVNLEKVIAMPMILINSIGVVIFINIIRNARQEYNKIGAIEAQKVLNIAKRTMDYLRQGLDEKTAHKVAEIISEIGNVNGVFVGDRNGLLAYYGNKIEQSELSKQVAEYYKNPDTRAICFKSYNKDIFFFCVPMIINESEFEGVIGLKVEKQKNIDTYFIEFSKELSSLLSTQMELCKLNELAREATTAELKALRSQIHPHFLFNALNTIASFCRTNPHKARELIINLSNFFRQTLKREEDFVTLSEELDFLESYLAIEKARFGDRLELLIDIPQEIMSMKVPVFIFQPLIENSIIHGILPKTYGGSVFIKGKAKKDRVVFMVEDTGIGMSKEKYNEILKSPGIGIKNVNQRLNLLYGNENKLKILTSQGKGTKVSFVIPREEI